MDIKNNESEKFLMSYKLLALDLDGTVLNSNKRISENTKMTINEAWESGIMIVLASGRPDVGIWPIARELELDQKSGYILSFNGAKIISCENRQILYERFIPENIIPLILAKAKHYGVSLMLYDKQCIITEQPEDPYIYLAAKNNGLSIYAVTDIKEHIKFPVNKFLLTADADYLASIEKKLVSDFPMLNVYRSEPYFMEIMPKGIDKANGLSFLCKHLDISKSELICCGDGYNDITMLKYAGLGIAMENAGDEVKYSANEITSSNDNDGVAQVIKRYILKDMSA